MSYRPLDVKAIRQPNITPSIPYDQLLQALNHLVDVQEGVPDLVPGLVPATGQPFAVSQTASNTAIVGYIEPYIDVEEEWLVWSVNVFDSNNIAYTDLVILSYIDLLTNFKIPLSVMLSGVGNNGTGLSTTLGLPTTWTWPATGGPLGTQGFQSGGSVNTPPFGMEHGPGYVVFRKTDFQSHHNVIQIQTTTDATVGTRQWHATAYVTRRPYRR